MKQVNFSHPGGFPLEQETLERLQTAYRSELYEAIKRHLSILPDTNYIIAHAQNGKQGWAVIHQDGEGILYPMTSTVKTDYSKTDYLKTTKTTTNLIYGSGASQTAYTDYQAEYVSAKGTPTTNDTETVNYYDLGTFKTVKSIQEIEDILQSIGSKITSIQQDINIINQSYLPLNGSKAMQGDLNLGDYRLSRLDTKENYDATVRASDFNFGSANRRGLRHPENSLGRALVDSSTNTETSLTLNYDADWENTQIGGKVYLKNLNTNINGSLLVLDGSNQVIKSDTLIDDLISRIATLESKQSTAVPLGMIALWGKPAPFPDGWEEYVPLRGRMPVGLKTSDSLFDTLLNFGGSKTKTLTVEEMPEHTHAGHVVEASGDWHAGGNNSAPNSTSTNGDTLPTGSGTPFSILNPYSVVHFIIYTGRSIEEIPPSPVDLTVGSFTATSVTLTWTPAYYERNIKNYLIYKDEYLIATINNMTSFYRVDGLSRSSSYDFYVIAVDAAGNTSEKSNTVRQKTKFL